MTDIAATLDDITRRINRTAQSGGRRGSDITLIAVSKMQDDARIDAALAAGMRVFGENRVQEAQARWAPRRDLDPDLRLHLIGPLQTNKAKQALALFDAIHTIDRPDLVRVLARGLGDARAKEFFVQVNTGEEPQKSGVAPADLGGLLDLCRAEGVPVSGLMCIPPAGAAAGLHFGLLQKLGRRFGLDQLSMGMSDDFEIAIRFGATHVRVGSALFGARAG